MELAFTLLGLNFVIQLCIAQIGTAVDTGLIHKLNEVFFNKEVTLS